MRELNMTTLQATCHVAELARFDALVETLGDPLDHPAPEGATGFLAELIVGAPPESRAYRRWEGALKDEPALVPWCGHWK